MQNNLYFICPSDHLEPIIDKKFGHKNYYITSLGNSIVFDQASVCEVNELLNTKNIKNIFFVLSSTNRILGEVMVDDQKNSLDLSLFQKRIKTQMKCAKEIWQPAHYEFLTFSYHLNDQIEDLRRKLSSIRIHQPSIKGLIYSPIDDSFKNIYTNMFRVNNVGVN